MGSQVLPGAQLEILVREVRAAARAELTAKQVWHQVCALAAQPVSFARVERVVRRARLLERESAAVNDENIAFVLNTLDVPVSDRNVLPYKTRSAATAAGKPAAKPAAVLAVPAAEPAVDTDDKVDDPDFVPPIESESEDSSEEEEELDDEAALLSARLERFDSPVSSKNVISGPRPARAAAVAARAAIEAQTARAVDVNQDEANDEDWVPCEDGEEAEDEEEELIEAPRVAVAVVATPPVAVLAAAPSAIAAPARTVLLPEDCTGRAALYCSTSKLRAPRSAPVQALVEQPVVVVEQQAAVIVVTEAAPEPTVVSQAASSAPRRAAPSFDPLTESSERCGDLCALL